MMFRNFSIGSDIESVKNYIKSERWKIIDVDELNGVQSQLSQKDQKYICKGHGIGVLSDRRYYYECSKSFSFEYACERNGGKLGKLCDDCIHNSCVSEEERPVFIDRSKACRSVGGSLTIKEIKVSEFCEIGRKHIVAEIGQYLTLFPLPLPMMTYVYAKWVFNIDGNLVDVIIQKEIEAS